MMYRTSGFPSIVTGPIEPMPIGDLLLMPFMRNVPLEKAKKLGTDYQRYLLSRVPFFHTKKYILISFSVQYLTSDLSPVKNVERDDREWHVDGGDTYDDLEHIFHIMASPCYSLPEFNMTSFEVEVPKPTEMITLINQDDHPLRSLIVGQEIKPYHIITFDNNNIHRAKKPPVPEFRFFFRVVESDSSYELDDTMGESFVFSSFQPAHKNITQDLVDTRVQSLTINFS